MTEDDVNNEEPFVQLALQCESVSLQPSSEAGDRSTPIRAVVSSSSLSESTCVSVSTPTAGAVSESTCASVSTPTAAAVSESTCASVSTPTAASVYASTPVSTPTSAGTLLFSQV